MCQQLVHRTLNEGSAMVDDRNVITHLFHLGKQVARKKDREPFIAELPDQMAYRHGPGRVEAVGRFVQEEDARTPDQGCGDSKALLHAK
jgi:hypothetical protein